MTSRIVLAWACLVAVAGSAAAQPDRTYRAIVLGESADKVTFIRFGPDGAAIDRSIDTGTSPMEIDGPHGVDVAPDGAFYYVSLGHGNPYGTLWKHRTADDHLEGRVELGLFPATLDLTPDGSRAFVVNFNLHGDRVPSSVSVVATAPMVELARIQTCVMPHGSRLSPDGRSHYSACMMDDALVEIDTRALEVSRHFRLTAGARAGGPGRPERATAVTCMPTWAQPSADGSSVFVACNRSNEIVEIDTESWEARRTLTARDGVYNLAVTDDGRLLLATNKRDASVSIFDLESGEEKARIPTRRAVVHGVAVTADDRYAFVTVEGVGAEPGTVEIVDIRALRIVASLDVPAQAAGVDVLPLDP